MRSVLTAGDSSFAQVVKTTILLADIKDFRTQTHPDTPGRRRRRWLSAERAATDRARAHGCPDKCSSNSLPPLVRAV